MAGQHRVTPLSVTGCPDATARHLASDEASVGNSRGLQGLDGDATEPMVESLPDPMRDSADPEEEFQVAAAFLEPPVQGAHAQPRHQARRLVEFWAGALLSLEPCSSCNPCADRSYVLSLRLRSSL